MQDHLQNSQEPSCPDAPKVEAVSPDSNSLSSASNSDFAARFDAAKSGHDTGSSGVQSDAMKNVCDAEAENLSVRSEQSTDSPNQKSGNVGEITAILNDVDAMRKQSSAEPDAPSSSKANPTNLADTSQTEKEAPKNQKPSSKPSSPKKKKKVNPFVAAWRNIFPCKGDEPLEVIRKIVFLIAIVVFVVCFYLFVDYYFDLHVADNKYEAIQDELGSFIAESTPTKEEHQHQDMFDEYYEYNDVGNTLIKQNPDVVGYITIPDTKVSYPVVQKKSPDININTNDYYLYRAFDQSESRAGCIFMDYRCHFDEVVVHRLSIKNSTNLLIYGHNMKDESMFGTLKYYQRNVFSNPEKTSYYSKHPIITLHSLYKSYNYKIFAVFLVDGGDTTSEYAFDCWNTFDFEDEDSFYTFVNNAKRRNIVKNDVDVTYGDQLLTLYTCSGTIPSGKLIIMARMVRPDEDPLAGTEHGCLNDNILWPKVYYNNHDFTYDESQFVPYNAD